MNFRVTGTARSLLRIQGKRGKRDGTLAAGPEGCGIRLHCQRCIEPGSFHRCASSDTALKRMAPFIAATTALKKKV